LSNIDFHSSARAENLAAEWEASLQSNRLDPKFLYVTPRQAKLWRQVALRHSPVQRNPEFLRIYGEAFARTAADLRGVPQIWLIGLGCGTGGKEAQLCHALWTNAGAEIFFSAVDVSADLIREAANRLANSQAVPRSHLVCDLGRPDAVREWLSGQDDSLPRVITFFGLVPNFLPSRVGDILRAALRPGDVLLASVHLAPVGGEKDLDLSSAMRAVLPQYDNPETLAWLNAGLEQGGLAGRVDAPEIEIGEIESVPAFLGHARWKPDAPQKPPAPLRLFYSLRYTVGLFEALLRREGFLGEQLAITACREEAIWRIRLA
jgi:L-histidine Nalpha-methyltransferase